MGDVEGLMPDTGGVMGKGEDSAVSRMRGNDALTPSLALTVRRRADEVGDDRGEHPQSNDGARDAGIGGGAKLKLRESRSVGRLGLAASRATTPRNNAEVTAFGPVTSLNHRAQITMLGSSGDRRSYAC